MKISARSKNLLYIIFIIFLDDTCAVCYFYFTVNTTGLKNPIDVYEEIEELAREEVLANGGSLSR
jgi:hypothetical protein